MLVIIADAVNPQGVGTHDMIYLRCRWTTKQLDHAPRDLR
jgi:hypothetical protein